VKAALPGKTEGKKKVSRTTRPTHELSRPEPLGPRPTRLGCYSSSTKVTSRLTL
jgi:hypothetical protein